MNASEPTSVPMKAQLDMADTLFAVLFALPQPISLEGLADTLDMPQPAVRGGLEKLKQKLESDGPLQLIEIQDGFQISTQPQYADVLARFLKPEPQKLSRSMMESLAIIAYRQPITLGEIEHIRGVMSDYSLRALVERGLVHDVGRKSTPGRPILYGTTPGFLHHFKLKGIDELPALDATQDETLVNLVQPNTI